MGLNGAALRRERRRRDSRGAGCQACCFNGAALRRERRLDCWRNT